MSYQSLTSTTQVLASVQTLSGTPVLMPLGTGRWFDMRLYSTVIGLNAGQYYYNDIINNNGNGVLSQW